MFIVQIVALALVIAVCSTLTRKAVLFGAEQIQKIGEQRRAARANKRKL